MWKISLSILVLTLCASTHNVFAADEWWEYGHFYQIYPRSFQDSDGDGIGDLNGITSRLSYLKYIGVTGVWLSPIYASPMLDFGYDITDFRAIQPEYGTMEDFEALVARCKELDMKLVLDFVPNHCSSQHEWFQKAINTSDPDHKKYKDYFLWHEGKFLENGTRVPPSNWLSYFRGSAWEWNDNVQAYYLHQFLEAQPEFNFRNPNVVNEMKEILRFWLRKGVSGFRCDAVPHIVEGKQGSDGNYIDEPLSGKCNDSLAACYLNHTQTMDQDETYELIQQFRRVVEEDEFSDHPKADAYFNHWSECYTTIPKVMRYFGEIENGTIVEGKEGVHIPFNFLLLQNTQLDTKSGEFKRTIEDWMNNMPKRKKIQANWVLGNHDNKRVASKYKPSRIDVFNILIKTLPGITITFNGEEIGMTNIQISWEDTVDPQACRSDPEHYEALSRDPVRSPFQWDSTKNAGFSSADKTWLPVALNYTDCNVNQQLRSSPSNLKVFRDLMELRQNPTMKYGGIETKAIDPEVLVYKRQIADDSSADLIIVVLNLETNTKTINLNEYFSDVPKEMTVKVASVHSTIKPGDEVKTGEIVISPEAGIVLLGNKE